MRPDDRGLVGFSLGGLFAAYVLAQRPAFFRRYLIVSPPVDFAREQVHAGLALQRTRPTEGAVYAARSEHDYLECAASWEPWLDALRGLAPSLQLHHEVFAGETHDSGVFPALLKGLQHVYGIPR